MQSKGAPRRRHSQALKARVLSECSEAGASVAAIAQAHGLNANLVHKWRRGTGRATQAAVTQAAVTQASPDAACGAGVFVPLQLPQPARAATPDIRIELRRGATSMTVTWPAQATVECAAWMRELLR